MADERLMKARGQKSKLKSEKFTDFGTHQTHQD